MADEAPTPLRSSSRRNQVDEWALVLSSQGLHPGVARGHAVFTLMVPAAECERAAQVLEDYDSESTGSIAEAPATAPPPPDWIAGGVILAAMLVFFGITGPRDPSVEWFARGSADAARILAGETWRAATALTLHADLAHVLGNTLAGFIFVSAVCGALGFGAGGVLVFGAGVLGNLANAGFHVERHSSVGASTAIFGAVGLLTALAIGHHWRGGLRGRRALAPFAAGLGLLAMLGTSARSDFSAHLFGLLAGVVLGLGWVLSGWARPGLATQWLLALIGATTLFACWQRALA